ncbi:MAG: EamA family transporter [Ignavibacteriae bacterium]|nr:EamA family transporter [Ignavibacteriota bacterium]
MKILQRIHPILLVVIGMVSVQWGAALAKSLFAEFGAMTAVFWRVALAAIMLLIIVRPALRALSRQQWQTSMIFGIVLVSMNATYYFSLQRLPLGLCVTIEFVGPLAVAIWHSHRALDFVWVALAALGIALLNPFSGHVDAIGFVLALIAGACWGLYIILGEKLGSATPGALGLTIAMSIGSLVLVPLKIIDAPQWLNILPALPIAAAVALLSSVIPYSLEIEALRRMPTKVFGILMSMEPACAAVVGFLLLGERLTLWQCIAIGAVMTASFGSARGASNVPMDA